MADKSSDAERLLNTIVAARVRLSGLRGEQSVQREKTPSTAPARTADSSIREAKGQDDFASEEEGFPFGPGDQQVDDETHDHTEEPLVLGIDPIEDDLPALSLSSTDETTEETVEETVEESVEESVEETPEETPTDDPFSFIDLIPPEDVSNLPEGAPDSKPSLAPPPIREKPKMPLPLGLAAGAPPSPPLPKVSSKPPEPVLPVQVSEEEKPPEPVLPVQVSEEELQVAPTTTHLTAPKKVAPRILDPNRSVLEVDVFEDEVFEEPDFGPTAPPPRLTEPNKTRRAPRVFREQNRTEDELFDTMTDAVNHLRKGDLRAAHLLFSDVLDWIPEHLEARLARGRCNRDLGDTVAALSDFRRAEMQAGHSPAPHIEIGDLFFAKKDYIRAASHYDDALAIDPQNALTLCRRGICYHHRRRPDRAVEDLVMAQAINPEIPNIDRYIRMVQPGRK